MQLPPQGWMDQPATKKLLEKCNAAQIEVRFVGGCVRDAVMGRRVKDMDLATPMLPREVMRRLRESGLKVVPTGIDHGTVTVVVDGTPFEITTLRKDVACDGRHAEVAYTKDWKQDASRRDFTMNALYCDALGRITDFFGGAGDAHAGLVQFIGDAHARIREDYLRILRFFRFYATHGEGEADATAIAACTAEKSGLADLSGERIQHEMMRLLAAKHPVAAVSLMVQHGVWDRVAPAGVNPDLLSRLMHLEDDLHLAPDAHVRLALLLRTLPDPLAAVSALHDRWKLSNKTLDLLQLLLTPRAWAWHSFMDDYKPVLRSMGEDAFVAFTLVQAALDNMDKPKTLHAILKLAKTWQPPAFPVSGNDLLRIGIKPGPEMGEILQKLELAWEAEGYAPTKEQLLGRVKI